MTNLEKAKCTSTNETAATFGDALGYVFSIGLEGRKKEIAHCIGSSIGRFIYLCDAADDMEEDIKKKKYIEKTIKL